MDHFLKSTCDISLFYNQYDNYKDSDRGHDDFSKSTCDTGDPSQGPLPAGPQISHYASPFPLYTLHGPDVTERASLC